MFAKEENLNIRVIRNMIVIPEDLASTRSTVLILNDPIKTQYTDEHNHEILRVLQQLRANAEESNGFQIAVFHCNDIRFIDGLYSNAKERSRNLYPKKVCVSLPTETMLEILQGKEEENVSSEFQGKLTMDKIGYNMECKFTLALFLKSPSNQGTKFLDKFITFILKRLEEMVESQEKPVDERAQFKLLVDMMLRNRKIAEAEVENIVDHALSTADLEEGRDRGNLIRECIQHLNHSFIEKTPDRISYRLKHDVITRCILFTALKHSNYNSVFRECDPLLLFDCIRSKNETS